MPFTLSSSAFRPGDTIPAIHTCDGGDTPPPLGWSGAPPGTRSFALIMDDPDAPGGTFTHWLLCDIPAGTTELPLKDAGRSLRNGFGRTGYGGPCPPRGHGPHRYVFTLYAVDVSTLDLPGKGRADLDSELRAHTLARATLTGRYERTR